MSDTYKCEACGETYDKGRPDEEAMAEAEEIFGAELDDNPAIVCDDCWRKMMGLPAIQ